MVQKYFKSVIFVSVAILVYQGIANSYLGILSQVTHQNGNNWAGPVSTALLFIGSGLGSTYNKYIGKYPFKFCFFIGSFGYIVFTSLGLLFLKLGFNVTVQILLFVLSFVAGAACSVFYNTQFNYINFLSKIDAREVKYFGINMGFAQSSNIFGNLLSSLLIQPLGQFLSVLIMSIGILAISFLFLFVNEPTKEEMNKITEQQQKIVDKNLIANQSDKQKQRPPQKVCSAFIFSGIIISFIYCILSIIIYKAFEDDMEQTELNHMTFVLFIFEGIGQFFGGLAVIFLSGRIKDVPKLLPIINSLFIFSIAVIYSGAQLKNVYIIGIGIVLTGFSDCFSFSLSLTLAGEWQQAGITAFNIRQSLTVAVTSILAVFLSVQLCLVWILIFYLWNAIGLHLYTKQKQNNFAQSQISSS